MDIKAKKDMFNKGKCFTKGQIYSVSHTNNLAGLIERTTTNDQGELHIIGSWWRNFKIIKS